MLYRLEVTGYSSRVVLREMLRGLADSFATTALQICLNVLLPDRDRPNVPVCRFGCRVVVIFASVPDGFGPGPKMVWRSEPLDREFASLHLSPLRFLCLPLRRLEARAKLELDGRCYYPTGRSLRLPSRRQVACAELELDGRCYYPTGRGLRLPSRCQVACAEPELDGRCYYPTGRGLRLPSRRQVARAEQELEGCATTLLDEVYPTTDPGVLPPTSGLARRQWQRGARRYLESASLHLSPLTSGLAWRRRRRGAQLDGEFVFCASRSLLRAWPGGCVRDWESDTVCFSSSFQVAHCFGLGQEAMAKVHMDKEFAFLRLSPPTSDGGLPSWLEGLLLPLALAGPAGVLKNALLRRSLGCYVADCA